MNSQGPTQPLITLEAIGDIYEATTSGPLITTLVLERHIEDQGSPKPQHDATRLFDLEVYHTINYSEGVSQYHKQDSNSVTTINSNIFDEAPFNPKEDILSRKEVDSYMWQHSKSQRKKKTLPLRVMKPQATSTYISPGDLDYPMQTMLHPFFQMLNIPTSKSRRAWNCKVILLYIRKIPSPR